MPNLDPVAIGFVALNMIIGIMIMAWLFRGIQNPTAYDYFIAILIVCFPVFALMALLANLGWVKLRERLRI